MKVFDGAKLKALRDDAGMTQRDLAPKVDITQVRISSIERNMMTPTTAEIDAFGLVLNVPVTAFLSDDKDIVKVQNTYSKKKTPGESLSIEWDTEQLEQLGLFSPDIPTGLDLAGYSLISNAEYDRLRTDSDKYRKLQGLLGGTV
ncbi:TPA: helix-turn-helix transcriptional regulator [Streptococcus suis]|nr:helix-turn-helix transcriptional regulator [Streptococcus suis]